MRRRLLTLAGVAAAVAVVVGILVATAGGGATRAPSLAPLSRLGGGVPVALPSGHGPGRPTAVTFFASWCSPCRTELPAIARVASQEAASGGAVGFVGIDGNDDPGSGLAFARASGVTFPVGMDPSSAVAPRFGLVGYPDTVFIDRRGEIAGIVRGPISEATLRQWMARLAPA
jgi:thiol-disulfide isomerase/thioredoxin